MTDKPPYRVPPLAEIAEPGPDAPTVVSTFSGCGGSCLGFRYAGFRTLWASEFVEAARDTYRANHPGVIVDERDIRDVTAADVLAATGLEVGALDVLEGSPPCASFSTAGKRSAKWGRVDRYSDTAQRSDDLFFEYARLVDGIRPRVFVAENVAGLTKGVAKGYFKRILAALGDCGYRVGARVLDAQWLGVPQRRRRVIFLGVRDDLDREPVYPSPLPYRYSIRDALPWLGEIATKQYGSPEFDAGSVDDPTATIMAFGADGVARHQVLVGATYRYDTRGGFPVEEFDVDDGPVPTITTTPGHHTVRVGDVAASLDGYAIGAEWDRLRPGESSDRYLNLVRPDGDEPCPTVTQLGGASGGVASVTHPTERRKFTIAELRRLCGFPDDFVLTGSYAQQWERLGRAVPPPMMQAVAETIRREVL